MANPSLQIGNDNWAIKEDNLLGYSTAGTRFVPQPITMTRASAGTRVNSSGLVETVELLGSELITNGSFDTAIAINVAGSGWKKVIAGDCTVEYANGGVKLTQASVGNQDCKLYAQTVGGSNNLLTVGKYYKVTYEVLSNNNSTSLKYYEGGAYAVIDHTVGTHTFYYQQGANQLSVFWNRTANSDITLDNISIKESTKNNLARVDYDGTASSLLAEPQRTNLVPYSEDLTNAFYLTTGIVTVTESTTLSPDGTSYGYTITPTSSATNHYFNYDYGQLTVVIGDEVTYSIFVKPNGYNFIQIASSSGFPAKYQNFELTGDGVIGTGDISGKTIEKIGDWYRCSVTETASGVNPRFLLSPSETALATRNPVYSGNGTDGVLGWGVQVEVGSYATSYIPTDGGTVTRVQDQYSKTGISNLINSEEGVLFVEMAALSDDETNREITLSDGIGSNYVLIRFNSGGSNRIYTRVDVGSVVQYYDLDTSHTITNTNKIAIRWGVSNFATFINGVKVGSQLSGSSFSADTLNELNFDNGTGGSNFFGKVKQLQVFKTALTDTELETLTTI